MRVLFTSWNVFSDPNCGLTSSCALQMKLLAESGDSVQVLTAAKMAVPSNKNLQRIVANLGVNSPERFELGSKLLVNVNWSGLDVALLCTQQPVLAEPDRGDSNAYIAHFQRLIREFRPIVTVICGPENILLESARLAKKAGSKVVFMLNQFGLEDRKYFASADRVLSNSNALGGHYFKSLGLRSYVVYPVLDEKLNLVGEGAHDEIVIRYPSQPNDQVFFKDCVSRLREASADTKISVVDEINAIDANFCENLNLKLIEKSVAAQEYLGKARIFVDLESRSEFHETAMKAHLNGIPVANLIGTTASEITGKTRSSWPKEQLTTEIYRHFTDLEFYSKQVLEARENYESRFSKEVQKQRIHQYFKAFDPIKRVAPNGATLSNFNV